MSDTGVHQFDLDDADGVSHSYVVTEHPAGDGMEIMYSILALGAPAVLALAGSALKYDDVVAAVVGAVKGDDSEAMDLTALVASLDLDAVGRELGAALMTGQAPDLTRRALSRTHRDGQPLSRAFDIAYQANYVEMMQALWKVCRINRFFPLPSMSPSLQTGTKAAQLD